mmetsp:Transcript_47851/g.93975  ORF Transcript_47851/g.93975 Transcript_47851/m.93975 type:complete len:547 (+) Transcript_47851:2-1642(+)
MEQIARTIQKILRKQSPTKQRIFQQKLQNFETTALDCMETLDFTGPSTRRPRSKSLPLIDGSPESFSHECKLPRKETAKGQEQASVACSSPFQPPSRVRSSTSSSLAFTSTSTENFGENQPDVVDTESHYIDMFSATSLCLSPAPFISFNCSGQKPSDNNCKTSASIEVVDDPECVGKVVLDLMNVYDDVSPAVPSLPSSCTEFVQSANTDSDESPMEQANEQPECAAVDSDLQPQVALDTTPTETALVPTSVACPAPYSPAAAQATEAAMLTMLSPPPPPDSTPPPKIYQQQMLHPKEEQVSVCTVPATSVETPKSNRNSLSKLSSMQVSASFCILPTSATRFTKLSHILAPKTIERSSSKPEKSDQISNTAKQTSVLISANASSDHDLSLLKGNKSKRTLSMAGGLSETYTAPSSINPSFRAQNCITQLVVPSSHTVTEKSGWFNKSFTQYNILLTVAGVEKSVTKRYSEFVAFDADLRKRFPSSTLKCFGCHELPGKSSLRLRSAMSPEVIEERRVAFEAYLCALLTIPGGIVSDALSRFLEL